MEFCCCYDWKSFHRFSDEELEYNIWIFTDHKNWSLNLFMTEIVKKIEVIIKIITTNYLVSNFYIGCRIVVEKN